MQSFSLKKMAFMYCVENILATGALECRADGTQHVSSVYEQKVSFCSSLAAYIDDSVLVDCRDDIQGMASQLVASVRMRDRAPNWYREMKNLEKSDETVYREIYRRPDVPVSGGPTLPIDQRMSSQCDACGLLIEAGNQIMSKALADHYLVCRGPRADRGERVEFGGQDKP